MSRRPPTPIGFAHRGARAECRDNTLAGFDRALELGSEGLESDVWLTADGVAVLDHDGLVRRGARRVPIAQLARDALPRHVPALADLYRSCGVDFELSLDVKDPSAAPAVLAAADAAGATGRLWLCGTGAPLLAWRALSAQVRLVDSTRRYRMVGGTVAHAGRLAAAGVDAVNLRWREWDRRAVAAVHGAGLAAFAWDAQQPSALAWLLDLGLDGVYSDHVGRMRAALEVRTR